MNKKATIQVPGLKVAVPLSADMLPTDLVPAEGPAGEPMIEIVVQGSNLAVLAKINGKNYRKMMKQVAGQEAGTVMIILQGLMKPAATPGGPFVLEGAGFQVIVKTPKPSESGGGASEPG